MQAHADPIPGIIMTGDYIPSSGCSCGQQLRYQHPNPQPCNCGHPQCTCGATIPFLPPRPTCCGMPGCSCRQNSRFYNPKEEVESIYSYETSKPKDEDEVIYGFEMKLIDPKATEVQDSNQTPIQPPCGGCGTCDDCLKGYINYRSKRAIRHSNENKLKKYGANESSKKKKRSKSITKRDINYEFKDFDFGSEYPTDFSIPEIIQYMPETLLPNFEKGQCFFANKEPTIQKRYAADEVPINGLGRLHEFEVDPSMYRSQSEAESLHLNQEQAFLDPMQLRADLFSDSQKSFGVNQFHRNAEKDPLVGAAQYSPNPQYRDPKMDHLVKQIVYSHPDFIEANNHGIPGPSLTPPEEIQEEELSDFFTKLVRGRIGQMFGEEHHQQYGHYGPQHHHQNQYDRHYRNVDEEDEDDIFGV